MPNNKNPSEKIGVPPHKKPWPTDTKYDPELLQNGDYRNVIDKYRYWFLEEIKKNKIKKLIEKPRSEMSITGLRPYLSLRLPKIGANANCINA